MKKKKEGRENRFTKKIFYNLEIRFIDEKEERSNDKNMLKLLILQRKV